MTTTTSDTSMVNCSRARFAGLLEERPRKTAYAELRKLAHPEGGLFKHGLFRYTENGRQIAPSTWLTAARADKRNKLAFGRLLEREYESIGAEGAHENDTDGEGRARRRRLPPSPAALASALRKQRELLALARAACPTFFAGLYEEAQQALAR